MARTDARIMAGNGPRYWNVILGVWLFISAFAWQHTQAQQTNTWIVGLLGVAFALWAIAAPAMRYLNTALAVWLFISVWALPTVNAATVWNNIIVAVAMFVISLVPARIERRAERIAEPRPRARPAETRPPDVQQPR